MLVEADDRVSPIEPWYAALDLSLFIRKATRSDLAFLSRDEEVLAQPGRQAKQPGGPQRATPNKHRAHVHRMSERH